MCHALPALHAFTGCDSISAFVKTLKDYGDFMDVFLTLGRAPVVTDNSFQRLEEFVCLLYSKNSGTNDINIMRYEKFLERFSAKSGTLITTYDGVDMSLLPPCRSALKMHVKRANYQALIWYMADHAAPNIPSPDGHGWEVIDGQLEIKWTEGDLLPQELVDVLVDEPDQNHEADEVDEFEDFTDVIYED